MDPELYVFPNLKSLQKRGINRELHELCAGQEDVEQSRSPQKRGINRELRECALRA